VNALDRVTQALTAAGSSQRHGGNFNCPTGNHSNGDVKPSLSVDYRAGKVVLYCHLGCETRDIMDALDLKWDDMFDEALTRPEPQYFKYTSREGEVLYAKLKYFPKRFSIKHPNGNGWEDGIPQGTPRVLYNLPATLQAAGNHETIYLVEGEKDANRLIEMGYTATSNFEGAGVGKPKWHQDYTDSLAGASQVIIIADRDDAGVAHAKGIAELIKNSVGTVRILQSATTGIGDDVSDHLDSGLSLDELVPLRDENEITRKYTAVNWMIAFKQQPEDVEWLVPDFIEEGTLNAIYSAPGVGKSLLALEVAVEVVRSGRTVVYIDQENRIHDTVERLTSFGVRPEELDRLLLYSFPALPPLDTKDGGTHLGAIAEAADCSLIVLDTLSRMVEGGENESDTYLSLYRNTLAPLKGKGIATLRLDHSGKNESSRQRGSSSKEGDIDVLFHLTRDGDNHFSLECEKTRSGHIPYGQLINLTRDYDPLRHTWNVRIDIPLNKFEGIMRQMDLFSIPTTYGRDRVRKVLKDNHVVGVRNDLLGAAITERRNRVRRNTSYLSGTNGDKRDEQEDANEECPF